jgi:hypothetical protein
MCTIELHTLCTSAGTHPNIMAIKELNQEEPCDVYLWKYSTEVVKGNTSKCGKPIISCMTGTSGYHGFCDLIQWLCQVLMLGIQKNNAIYEL